MKAILLTGLGFLFLGLGAIGLLVPVWPTTPFVLVSFACFSSSPRIKGRIMEIPFFKEHIENYENRCGLSKKTLSFSMIWLWGGLLLSMFLSDAAWIKMMLFFVGVAVTWHLMWMSRCREKEEES